jgi:phage gpG-like protein
MPVEFRINGINQVKGRFNGMSMRAKDVSRAWPHVGSYLSRAMMRQFVTEGKYLGRPWKPLQPDYRLWKIRNGYSRKILVQTGQMRKTFTSRPMDIEQYRGNRARFGSSDQKAVWHHYGTRRNGKRVNPPRKILVVNKRIRRDVRDILAKYIRDGEV